MAWRINSRHKRREVARRVVCAANLFARQILSSDRVRSNSGCPRGGYSFFYAQPFLACRAQFQNHAARARRAVEVAAFLAVQHQHFVVVVNLLRVPFARKLRFQNAMRRPDRKTLRNQFQALRDAMMMRINWKRAAAQRRKRQNRRAGFRADARQFFEPFSRTFNFHFA